MQAQQTLQGAPPAFNMPHMASANQQPTVVFVTQQALTSRSGVREEPPKVLPLKAFHFVFGIVQMVIAVLVFVIEVAALSSGVFIIYGPGVYTGVFIFVSGLLSMLAGKLNKRCLIIACMILNIITTVACTIGIGFASIEINEFHFYSWVSSYPISYSSPSFVRLSTSVTRFGYGKSIFVLIICIFEFIATIVHAVLTCRSFCTCCLPRNQRPAPSNQQGFAYINQAAYPTQGNAHIPQGAMIIPQGAMMGSQGVAYSLQQQPYMYNGLQQQPAQFQILPGTQPTQLSQQPSVQPSMQPSVQPASQPSVQPQVDQMPGPPSYNGVSITK